MKTKYLNFRHGYDLLCFNLNNYIHTLISNAFDNRSKALSQGGNYPCLIIINHLYYTEIKIHPHNQSL